MTRYHRLPQSLDFLAVATRLLTPLRALDLEITAHSLVIDRDGRPLSNVHLTRLDCARE